MPRKLRLEYAGVCYHVINRGNYRRSLFAAEGTAESFERCLFEAAELRAIPDQALVDDFGPVIRIQRSQRKRQRYTHPIARLNHKGAFAHHQRGAFRPSRRNIRQHERVDETPSRTTSGRWRNRA